MKPARWPPSTSESWWRLRSVSWSIPAEGWPQRAAKVVLQLALTSLARHYGLIAPERSPFARVRHWGDEDYRPGLDAWR